MPDHDPTFSLQDEIENQVAWEDLKMWALVQDYPRPLTVDTTDYSPQSTLEKIYHFARSCLP